MSARPRHPAQDERIVEAFKKNFPRAEGSSRRTAGDNAGRNPVQDEARIGQKNGQVRQWARRGTRPRQPADQRYDNAYLFGAICPARGVGAALALPYADADMMRLHLDEISRNVAAGAHAVLLLDRAGWQPPASSTCPKTSPRSSCLRAPRSSTGGERLAVSPPELALKHRLRKLRRHHRRRLRRLAQTHRPARNHHINRKAPLGSRRSAAVTSGISWRLRRPRAAVPTNEWSGGRALWPPGMLDGHEEPDNGTVFTAPRAGPPLRQENERARRFAPLERGVSVGGFGEGPLPADPDLHLAALDDPKQVARHFLRPQTV